MKVRVKVRVEISPFIGEENFRQIGTICLNWILKNPNANWTRQTSGLDQTYCVSVSAVS